MTAGEPHPWVRVRRTAPRDLTFVRSQLVQHWLSTTIYSIDRRFEADQLPGFIAEADGGPAGHITTFFDDERRDCEVVTLSSTIEGRGIGSALLAAAIDHARGRGCSRLFLTTTNDNLRALAFYQRRGMRLVAVHRGMIDLYRERYNAAIPPVGMNGLPLRDEIELEYTL